jgi:hypothetical protein
MGSYLDPTSQPPNPCEDLQMMAGVLLVAVSCAREAPAEVQRANQAGDAGQFGGACPLHRDVSIMPAPGRA